MPQPTRRLIPESIKEPAPPPHPNALDAGRQVEGRRAAWPWKASGFRRRVFPLSGMGARAWKPVIVCVLAAAACSAPSSIEIPFAQGAADTPTSAAIVPTPPPAPSVLVVCLAEEPDTLYIYGGPNRSAQTILPALYDGPIDVLGYQFRPVILEVLPSVEAGTARLEPVSLSSGDLYFNPETSLPDTLRIGKPYLPQGCTSFDCVRTFEGGQVQLDRLVVDFRLLSGLRWSDGEPLTAQDSVFSFHLDSHPDTPTLKDQVHRTATYEALDEQTVRWSGIPGFLDPEFAGNFWSPLPEHLLGDIAPGDLPPSEAASRAPVGWGPYALERWESGQSMEFVRNPNYHRRTQGLPAFDHLLVRFLGERDAGALQQVLTGECDVLEESLVGPGVLDRLQLYSGQGRIRLSSVPGVLMERLDFDTAPADDRAAVLSDPATRRALAACIDRQGLIDQVLGGLSPVPGSYLATGHPLAVTGKGGPPHDAAAGAQELESLGWIDQDGEPSTPRVAHGVAGMENGAALELSLLTPEDSVQAAVGAAIADDLAGCGAAISVESVPSEDLFTPWPDGAVFGRSFDLVAWPWLQWISPACEVFSSPEIPSTENPEGSNASGFRDAAFDEACAQAVLGPMAGAAYTVSVTEVQSILSEAVPSLPLLQWPRTLIASPLVCGQRADPTAGSLLWNLEEFTPGPVCE